MIGALSVYTTTRIFFTRAFIITHLFFVLLEEVLIKNIGFSSQIQQSVQVVKVLLQQLILLKPQQSTVEKLKQVVEKLEQGFDDRLLLPPLPPKLKELQMYLQNKIERMVEETELPVQPELELELLKLLEQLNTYLAKCENNCIIFVPYFLEKQKKLNEILQQLVKLVKLI